MVKYKAVAVCIMKPLKKDTNNSSKQDSKIGVSAGNDSTVVNEIIKPKKCKFVLSKKYIIFITILLVIAVGLTAFIIFKKSDKPQSLDSQLTQSDLINLIKDDISAQQNNAPAENTAIEQKRAYYEGYFESLFAVGDENKVVDVYINKVAPLEIYFNRELQDLIAQALIKNGQAAFAKKLYQNSLYQANIEITNANNDEKVFIAKDITIYESRISNL
jgi:hypothetical protein